MKKVILIMLMIFACFALYAFKFRNNEWGASLNEVIRSEGKEPVDKNEELLVYKDELNNLDCGIIYNFINNELYSGSYIFINKHSNKTLYISDYKELKSLLIKKYGIPIDDKIIWRDDLYKDDPSSWGMAISIGHLSYGSRWKIDNTEINISLTGDNYKIHIGIIYINEQASEKVDEVKSKRIEDKL